MKMPKFTAEKSLCRASGMYNSLGSFGWIKKGYVSSAFIPIPKEGFCSLCRAKCLNQGGNPSFPWDPFAVDCQTCRFICGTREIVMREAI